LYNIPLMEQDNALAIPMPTDEELGPAMRKLNDRQKRYVIAWLMEPSSQGHSRAVRIAGYGNGNSNSERQQAWLLSHNPRVMAAVKEEADRRMKYGAIIAASRLLEFVEDKTHKDSFKATVEMLNRAGLIVETQHRVIVENDDNMLSAIERVKVQAHKLGLDPVMLLGKIGITLDTEGNPVNNNAPDRVNAVDAEFTEVEGDDEWTV